MESWVGTGRHGSTAVMTEWQPFVQNQAAAARTRSPARSWSASTCKPYATTQAPERDDILNIGGFSDAVFKVVAAFLTR